MLYSEAVSWLFSRFPAYQNLGASAYKPDLHNVKRLLEVLNHPEKQLNFIHIAGTNGKGSTSHILAALGQEHGLTTGIFTSPHLVDFRERIKVNGQQIPQEKVVHWVETVIPSLNINFEPSFFELTFALALCYFLEKDCDLCIIETGLGGRLDATNAITPLLSVITNIGYDHQNFLGNTRTEIASEKAGIIKAKTPILIAEQDPETQSVFLNKSNNEKALLRWVNLDENIESDLLGTYQQLNLNTAKQAFQWYCEIVNSPFNELVANRALLNVCSLTDFHGRMERIQNNPTVILDVAHNSSGILVLLEELKKLSYNKLHIVFGTAYDKDLTEVIPLLPKQAHFYLTQFANARSRKAAEWTAIGLSNILNFEVFHHPFQALQQAKNNAQKDDLILVFGSFFLVGEIIESLEKASERQQ
jgi:dihydrofolate synthase/folylpolyglutamate synthase